jgi:hypothetical protein
MVSAGIGDSFSLPSAQPLCLLNVIIHLTYGINAKHLGFSLYSKNENAWLGV